MATRPRRVPSVVSRRLATAILAAGAATLPGTPVAAQEGCILGDRGRNDTFIQTLPGIGRVTYIGGPHFDCGGGVQIFADSAVAYGERGMSHLIGSVRYMEDGREMRAAEARYFTNEGRLQAQGDVIVNDEEQGFSVRDGDLVYLLQTDFRDVAEMTVTTGADGIRPTAVLTPPPDTSTAPPDTSTAPPDTTIAPPDTSIAPPDTTTPEATEADSPTADARASEADAVRPEPYRVVAHRIYLRGSGYFTASDDVVIERDSLFAFADSAEYDQGGGGLTLVGRARVVGDSYELTGQRIEMTDPGGDASEVHALREARLTGEDVLLTAARIVVMLQEGDLDRLVATPIEPSEGAEPDSVDLERPEAFVEDFVLNADSVELWAPGEQVQRVFSSGRARSVSTARDSLNTEVLPEVAQKDWLEGDTVIIRFAGAPPVPPLDVPDAETLTVVRAGGPGSGLTGAGGPDSSVTGAVEPDSSVVGAAGPDSTAARPVVPDSTVSVTAADSVPLPPSAGPPTHEGGEPAIEAARGADELLGAADPTEEAEVEEIIARIGARSLYRIPPNDSTFRAGADQPAVHYVVGKEIRIRLESGGVQGMTVTGQTRGIHLEPIRRTAPPDSAAADSAAAAVPDTSLVPDTAVVPDTTGAVVDTTAVPDTSGVARPGADSPLRRNQSSNPTSQDGPVRLIQEHPWIRR